MLRTFKRIKNIARWNKAVDLAAEDDWRLALKKLDAMDRKNLGHLRPDFHILRAYLLMRIGTNSETKTAIAKALTELQRSSFLANPETIYRQKYAEWLIAVNYGAMPAKAVSYSGVDLSAVNKRTKRLFPLRDHPDWGKHSSL